MLPSSAKAISNHPRIHTFFSHRDVQDVQYVQVHILLPADSNTL